jgi:DNA-binding HxlR family transcriptional regulator
MSATCPSRVLLHRIGARWTVFIVNALANGPLRFGELKGHIRGITPKVLTETLRSMEVDGLVARSTFDENPPRVEYALTDLGFSLLVPLQAVREWAETHVPDVLATRDQNEAHELRMSAGTR